jgi:hypothetical protein
MTEDFKFNKQSVENASEVQPFKLTVGGWLLGLRALGIWVYNTKMIPKAER